MKKIQITDITLKKLAENREVSLLFREKTAIAACADSLGADAVELAPIRSVREDTIIYRTIAQNCAHSIVAIPVGFTEEEVEAAWACVKDAKAPRLQVELPVSTVQMEYVYHLKAPRSPPRRSPSAQTWNSRRWMRPARMPPSSQLQQRLRSMRVPAS